MTAHGDWCRLTIANRLAEMSAVPPFVEDAAARGGVGAECADRMNVVLDELLNNAISYGYDEGAPGRIEIALQVLHGRFCAEITDDGAFFDPEGVADLPAPARETGGLGLKFVRRLITDIKVERRGNVNITRLSIGGP